MLKHVQVSGLRHYPLQVEQATECARGGGDREGDRGAVLKEQVNYFVQE